MALEEAEEKIEVMYQRPQSACVVLVVVCRSSMSTFVQPDMLPFFHHCHVITSYSPQASGTPAPSKPLQSPPHSH